MVYQHFRATKAYEAIHGLSDYTISLQNDDFQEFDVRWDQALLSVRELSKNCSRLKTAVKLHKWSDDENSFQSWHNGLRRTKFESKDWRQGTKKPSKRIRLQRGKCIRQKEHNSVKLQVWYTMLIWKNMFLQISWTRRKSPAKSQTEVVRKDQLLYWRSLYNWVVCLKILTRENLFHVNLEIGIKTRRQILQRHLAPNQNSGKKWSIAKYYPKAGASWA